MDTVTSKNGVPIRLTEERWFHITETHDDLAGHYDDVLNAIEDPDFVIEGFLRALIGLKKIGRNKFLAVVYREKGREDGFVTTAYFTSKLKLERKVILWQKN